MLNLIILWVAVLYDREPENFQNLKTDAVQLKLAVNK